MERAMILRYAGGLKYVWHSVILIVKGVLKKSLLFLKLQMLMNKGDRLYL
jgi:hypothetical protein